MASQLSLLSDEELMSLVKKGDREAFSVLSKRYIRLSYFVANKIICDRVLSEDVVQDCFLNIWQYAYKFKDGATFKSWFYRVLTNVAIDTKRKNHITLEELNENLNLDSGDQSADRCISDKEVKTRLWKEIKKLPKNQEKAITLAYFTDVTNSEGSSIMKINLKAYESLLYRAKLKLKEGMSEI